MASSAEFARVYKTLVDGVHRFCRVLGKGNKPCVCAALRQIEYLFFGVGYGFFRTACAVGTLFHFAADTDKFAHGTGTLDNADVLVVVGGTGQQLVQLQYVVDVADLFQFAFAAQIVHDGSKPDGVGLVFVPTMCDCSEIACIAAKISR